MYKLAVIVPSFDRCQDFNNKLSWAIEKAKLHQEVLFYFALNSNYVIPKDVESFPDNLICHYNAGNIGAINNIMMAINNVNSFWISFVADKDEVASNYINSILDIINSNLSDKASLIKFDACFKKSFKASGNKEFFKESSRLFSNSQNQNKLSGSLFWLSNTVIRKDWYMENYEFSHFYSQSGVPHLMPLIFGLSDINTMLIIPENIATYKIPVRHYNPFLGRLRYGFYINLLQERQYINPLLNLMKPSLKSLIYSLISLYVNYPSFRQVYSLLSTHLTIYNYRFKILIKLASLLVILYIKIFRPNKKKIHSAFPRL